MQQVVLTVSLPIEYFNSSYPDSVTKVDLPPGRIGCIPFCCVGARSPILI